MVEDHRRVEQRTVIAGTGMSTDPERIEKLGDEAARRERAARGTPEQSFGAVLGHAPARGEFEDAVEPDRRRAAAPVDDDAAPAADAAPNPTTEPKKAMTSSKPKPSLPDPRERLLRQKLAALESVAKTGARTSSSETPPTGNSRLKK